MKTDLKLFYSVDKADPKKIYLLKVAIRKAGNKVQFFPWLDDPEGEQKNVTFLLFTFRTQLADQGKTIVDLGTPVLTWANPDGSIDLRVGYEDITKEL